MNEITPSERLELANVLGVAEQYLYQVFTGRRSASPELSVSIEQATKGAVTRKELRPDDWHLIWPELSKPKRKQVA